MAEKKTPVRMCAICRKMYPKKELLRLVKTPDGPVFFDATGKKAGRGLYLCKDPQCLDQAVNKNRLTKLLGAKLDETSLTQLQEAVKS